MIRGLWQLLSLLLLLGGAGLSAGVAQASPMFFLVSKVTGTVLTRSPNSFKWNSVVSNVRLIEGDIVQVLPGAMLGLRSRGGVGNDLAANETVLTIDVPMILRLDRNMLRTVALDRLFLSELPQAASEAVKQRDAPKLGWTEAWSRLAAIFTGTKPTAAQTDANGRESNQAMTLGMSSKKLQVLSPVTNSVLSGSPLPVEGKIVWLPGQGKDMQYYLYVWPIEGIIDAPVALTRQEFYTFQFQHYGSYNIQVTSRDGHWQSPLTVVHVVPASFKTAAEQLKAKTKSGGLLPPDSDPVTALYPPKTMLLVQDVLPSVVDFYWKPAVEGTFIYELTINRDDRKVTVQKRTGDTHLSVSLGLGSYTWTVSNFIPAKTKGGLLKPIATTEPRQLELTRGTPGAPTEAMIHGLLRSGTGGSVYLSRGL